jgi:phage tail-like protein
MSRPFTTFNFRVEITLDGASAPLCEAAFSECDGLELTMEPTSYQQGGDNTQQVHLAGPVSYGQLALKRGMTASFDLWDWFARVSDGAYELRATTVVTLLGSDGATERARFLLTRCLPVRLKAPALNAGDGGVAIEELEVAYERLRLDMPGSAGAGGTAGLGVAASASASFSF